MPVYMILDAELHIAKREDAAAYDRYKETAPVYVAWHVEEYPCRGGAVDVAIGDWEPERVAMLKFPSREAYDLFMADPGCKPWKELRESLSTFKKLVVLEGV